MADRERTVAEVDEELKAHVENRARLRVVREDVKLALWMEDGTQAARLVTIEESLRSTSQAIEDLMDERAEAEVVESNMDVLDSMLDEGAGL